MSVAIKSTDLINEIFNALDLKKLGKIDFCNFVCGISILQHGSPDEKLKFAFLAYDINHDNGIDQKELLMLLKSSSDAKFMALSMHELNAMSENVMIKYDMNRDGKLSFSEFQNAVAAREILINPFWLNANFRFGNDKFSPRVQFVDERTCVSCKKKFFPTGRSPYEKHCGVCARMHNSPYSTRKI